MYLETKEFFERKYGRRSEVVEFYEALVRDPTVSDIFVEAVYVFKDYPGIDDLIHRIYYDKLANGFGAGTELLYAYSLYKKGYEVLSIGMGGYKSIITQKGLVDEQKLVDIDIVAYHPRYKKYYFFEVKAPLKEGYNNEKLDKVNRFLIEMNIKDKTFSQEVRKVLSQFIESKAVNKIISILTTNSSLDRKYKKIVSPEGEIILKTLSGIENVGLLYYLSGEYEKYNKTVVINRREATGEIIRKDTVTTQQSQKSQGKQGKKQKRRNASLGENLDKVISGA
jgi:hypothetical protein